MASIDLPSSNALFLHIPKTAGWSVTTALKDGMPDAVPYPVRDMRRPIGAASWITSQLGGGVIADRWTFCFLRNPWDWTVSGWIHVTRNAPAYGTSPPDFERFLRGDWTAGLCGRPQAAKFRSARSYVAYHCRITQTRHIALGLARRPAPIAFYARFEKLAEDWARICERLERDLPLPHRNRSERTPYADYYTDETRRIVAQRNADLIERFGYRFEA